MIFYVKDIIGQTNVLYVLYVLGMLVVDQQIHVLMAYSEQ